jgi:autotransporter-associated beta strand protein
MNLMRGSTSQLTMGKPLGRPPFAWAIGLALVFVVTGLRSAAGQSTWKGAGGTLDKPLLWNDKNNWDVVPPGGGAAGYTLNFTGQNKPFVSSDNLGLNFKFTDLVLSTTFTGANGKLTGQVIEGRNLFATETKATPVPTIQQNGTGTFTILNKIDWGDSGIKLAGSAGGTLIIGRADDPTAGILTGSGKNPLVIDSSGNASFYLYGNNDYTSGTTLKAGTLVIGRSTDEKTKNSAIGRGALTLSGGTIRAAEGQGGNILFNPVTINGNTTFGAKVQGLTQNDILTLAGPTALMNNPKLTVAAAEADGTFVRTYLNGVISGKSDLTKDGPSVLSLGGTAANTYTGTTYVTQGTLELAKEPGIVAVPGNLVIGNGISTGQTVTLFNNDQIKSTSQVSIYQDATLNLQNKTQTIGSLADAGKGGGRVIIGAGSLTTGSAGSTAFSGKFEGGGGTLIKTGNTTFTLSGKSDTFTGTVVVEQGKLDLNKGQLGSKDKPLGMVEVKAGAVLTGTKGNGINNLNIWAPKGKVQIEKGGKLGFLSTPGAMGIASALDLQPGSHFGVVLAGPTPGDGFGHYSQLELVGGGTIQGSILDLTLTAAPGLNDRYTIIENLNSDFDTSNVAPLTGIFYDQSGDPLTGGSEIFATYGGTSYGFEVDYNQNASGYDVVLTDVSATAVPEPSSWVLLASGGMVLFVVSKRSQKGRCQAAGIGHQPIGERHDRSVSA